MQTNPTSLLEDEKTVEIEPYLCDDTATQTPGKFG